jgi:hypothetical protein
MDRLRNTAYRYLFHIISVIPSRSLQSWFAYLIISFFIFGSFSFRLAFFASFVFVSLMISSFSLRSETSEKTAFFRFDAKNFSLHFRFVSLRTENERRTLVLPRVILWSKMSNFLDI